MASLRELKLPPTTIESANQNLNWDESIAGANEARPWERPSLCSHAMARGTFVYGISPQISNNQDQDWISWKASFAPHQVCRVASNEDGSIIVASTQNGTVSLLRGSDGTVLATRRVSPSMQQRPAEVSFVANARLYKARDALIILVPTSDQIIPMTASSSKDEQQSVTNNNNTSVNVIIVSNINGEKLNGDSAAEAAAEMSIDALTLETPCKDFEALEGCFLNASTIRFAVGQADGNVSIHDYNVETKQATVVKKTIATASNEQTFLTSRGCKLQHCGNDATFLLVCGHLNNSLKLCWYDLLHLNMACEANIPMPSTKTTPSLLAMEPITSYANDSALAVAVALKESSTPSSGIVQVIQVHVEETLGLAVLSLPHKVYEIPLEAAAKDQCSLEGIDLDALQQAGPYAFRFLARYGGTTSSSQHVECREFVTQDARDIVGKIRLLLQLKMYDKVEEILAANDCQVLSMDPYAKFHPSEVALQRLDQLLLVSESLSEEEGMERARDLLRILIAGAVSGNAAGQQHLVEAADRVISWPSIGNKPTIAEFSMALSAMVTAIDTAQQTANQEFRSQLETKRKELEDRLSAMKCIQALIVTDSNEVALDVPFLNVRSPSEVFLVLMEDGFFCLAERFCRSDWGRLLTAETCASAILGLLPSQNPTSYASILKKSLLPRLTITHEAIPLIRAWACQCANAYDDADNEHGLDASIFLLETILEGMQELKLRVHASYAIFSPFVETKSKKLRQPSPRNASLYTTTSTFSSEASASSDTRRTEIEKRKLSSAAQQSIPTVLELGFLKGGAVKSKLRSIPSRRSGDAASFLDDEADDSEESVEIKLRNAKLLQKARELGLAKDIVSLRDYLKLGGTERVAKDLVRIYSQAVTGHEERYLVLSTKVKPFCDVAAIDYDQILVDYNEDLCDSKRTSARALVESSSIARCCFAPIVRCKITLAVLRVALLCGKTPPCLSELSRDSITWAAADPTVKSELEEATRLLVVDGIVRKYCGLGARELFRVDNPLHAVRLLDFVSRHFTTKSVLLDVFALCDAFTFLTREDACVLVLERAITSGDADLCVDLLKTVFSLDDAPAESVSRRVIKYCCQELEELCIAMTGKGPGFRLESMRAKAVSVCKVGSAVVEACHERFRGNENSLLAQPSFTTFVQDFGRIQRLQDHHGLYLPLSVFESKQSILDASRSLLNPVVEAFWEGNPEASSSLMKNAKAACAILAGPNGQDSREMWYAVAGEAASLLVNKSNDGCAIDFLAASGILDDFGTDDAVRAILSVALSFCHRASNQTANAVYFDDDEKRRMEDVIRASSLVHDYGLTGCPERMLEALVSLGLLTETVSKVVLRADEGLGESLEVLTESLGSDARARRLLSTRQTLYSEMVGANAVSISRPLLHPSWYVGDGLLLSPRDALSWSVAYSRDILGLCMTAEPSTVYMNGVAGLHQFLEGRGAHAAALRTCSAFAAIFLSSRWSPHALDGSTFVDELLQRDTVKALSERSMGGSGTGIMSVNIDSQLAVSFLLSLPLKTAFKVYKASLPTAITKRDFNRVITLANIGIRAGNGDFGWKNQEVFVSQCQRLSSCSKWWNILKFYQVDFDPSLFEENSQIKGEENSTGAPPSAYIASLVPDLIFRASLVHRSTDFVRSLATKFTQAFGLESILAVQKHIEYVLSPPQKDRVADRSDIRWDLKLCERAARDSLQLISSPMKRSAVLRKCVTSLESAGECDKDYERHALVLSLYHADLSLVVARDPTIRDLDASAFEEELEFIERRRDALEILSSYFQGSLSIYRPPFPKFFAPLSVPFSTNETNSTNDSYDIIGVSDGESTEAFDPLGPLQEYLSLHMDEAAAKALAPLTIPLGLPQGSIHARCLIERFRRCKIDNAALPSFENDVLPVLNRLKQATDQSKLAEWCASYYDDLDSQKLQCLDYGLRYAMTASREVEKRLNVRSTSDDGSLAAFERQALDAVKRLSDLHSTLSDRHEVNAILGSATVGMPQQFSSVEKIVRDLTDRLQENFWKSAESSPEKFVERLLLDASLLASEACLEQGASFSISQFRHMASIVHQACKRIADQYSHVHPGDISRILARRWLVHGDELAPGLKVAAKNRSTEGATDRAKGDVSVVSVSADEDDTVDFVMDLNENNAVWSDDVGSTARLERDQPTAISTEEEPMALQPDGSARERSERECTKVSLRVAFVMSFAEGYHKTQIGELNDDENISSIRANATGPKKSRPGLLSRISTKDTTTKNSVTAHAKELLRIVFAKSDSSSDPATSFVAPNASAQETCEENRKSLTFTMRYRALRTAAILCPQAALEDIVMDEGYLKTKRGDRDCSLAKCTYGAFVAKEIEEMGLPLPHSDLVQLSTMHFPSYGRALWRHHRDIDGKKGRLLLLLLEMSLRDSPDSDLAAIILAEMAKLQLPRTLLLGCECIAKYKLVSSVDQTTPSFLLNEESIVSHAVFTTANLILSEVHRLLSSTNATRQELYKGLPTVKRVGNLVENFSETETGQGQLCQFVKVIENLIALDEGGSFSRSFAEIALSATRCMNDAKTREELFVQLGKLASSGLEGSRSNDVRSHASTGSSSSTLLQLVSEIESSYHVSPVKHE